MSTKTLSDSARKLLNGMIWKENEWWTDVPNVRQRNKAMDELLSHRLIEVDPFKGCRATARGRISNRKWKESQGEFFPPPAGYQPRK